ncbi:MAG: TIGR04283 family arsenosugar biosynthesis glycosyltransferase [Pseudomonadota bacterium]
MFSFVLPVLNEESGLVTALVELRRRFPDSELIVVDGGSTDRSATIALAHSDFVLSSERGRAKQMNLGASKASREWLCFLHADTIPQFDGAQLASAVSLQTNPWGFCRVQLSGVSRLLPMVAWFMNKRSKLTSVATGDQMLLIEREFFQRNNGFATVPLMEDIEICKRLRTLAKPAVLPLMVVSSGRRWDQRGALRTILEMWSLRLAYWLGVSPGRLWEVYYGSGFSGSSKNTVSDAEKADKS